MRALVMIVALAACGQVRQVNRWPEHRRQKDQQLQALEAKVGTLEQQVRELQEQLRKTQAAVPSPGS